ncbi:MAG: hypothetical protein CVV27_10610 [Candidatus Melainabacteria bacterium HGW-Melainabacteria-1]|nr:MAG: hypothetical protein CVV27_10610 [Candidatus Melainabacteria bacterium HGW-Melainabacteria-1]
MTTIYEIEFRYLDILGRLEQAMAADDLSPEQVDQLNAELVINAAEFADKADAYAAVIGQKRARAEFLKGEAKRLTDMARAEEAIAERLQDRIAAAMTALGLAKADTAHYKLSFRKSTAVELAIEPQALPAIYQRPKTIIDADKAALKTALQAGQEIPGARLIERQSLQIR